MSEEEREALHAIAVALRDIVSIAAFGDAERRSVGKAMDAVAALRSDSPVSERQQGGWKWGVYADFGDGHVSFRESKEAAQASAEKTGFKAVCIFVPADGPPRGDCDCPDYVRPASTGGERDDRIRARAYRNGQRDVLEGAVPVEMVCGGDCNGIHFPRIDGEPIEWNRDGYWLVPRNRDGGDDV